MSMNPPAKKPAPKEVALATVRRELGRSREIILAIGGVILGFILGSN